MHVKTDIKYSSYKTARQWAKNGFLPKKDAVGVKLWANQYCQDCFEYFSLDDVIKATSEDIALFFKPERDRRNEKARQRRMLKAVRRRNLSNLKKQDINDLAEKGKYILSLCVDLETDNCFAPIEHHLPMYDTSKSEHEQKNWDLPDRERKTVEVYQKELMSYADLVVKAYSKANTDIIEILPLWLVFPTYSATTMGWRMGIGEQYQDIYLRMIETLSAEELASYKSKYPVPEYIRLRSGYDNVE